MLAQSHRPTGWFGTAPATPVALAAALALFVCSGVAGGSTQNASPKKWISAFCSSALTWQKQQKSGLTELSTLVEKYQKGDISLSTVKAKVVKYLADSVKATDKVIKRLKRVGAPAVKNGNALQHDELTLLGHAKRSFQNAKKTAQALSTNNVKTFGQDLAAVGKKMTAVSQNIGAAEARLHRYSSKALTDAARHEPACSQVRAFLP